LNVLYGGLGISKVIAIFDRKKDKFSSQLYFVHFLVIKTLDPDSLEMLDSDPDSMNPDPQHCFPCYLCFIYPTVTDGI
jgi:hypothetical protein